MHLLCGIVNLSDLGTTLFCDFSQLCLVALLLLCYYELLLVVQQSQCVHGNLDHTVERLQGQLAADVPTLSITGKPAEALPMQA